MASSNHCGVIQVSPTDLSYSFNTMAADPPTCSKNIASQTTPPSGRTAVIE